MAGTEQRTGDEVNHDASDHDDAATNRGEDEKDDSTSISSDDTVEPDCDGANNIQFALICNRMENLWKLRKSKKKKKVTQGQKLESILPTKLLEALKSQSIFPLLRLYCPDIDLARNYNIKERVIAQAYCNALGLTKNGRNYEMLYNFTDAQKVPQDIAGDLSLVVQHVMEDRISNQPSMMKVGDVNQLLDELAGLRHRQHHHNHQWREKGSPGKDSKKKVNLVELREKWLRKVIAKGLSPLEHKWLVRTIMKKPEFGLRSNTIMRMWSPYAIELYSAHNSLKSLCDKLANPEYEESRRKQEQLNAKMSQGISSRWDPQSQPVILGNVLSPMLSSKLTFEKCMTQISANHTEYLKASPGKDKLALKFPVVCAEVKLDGERMIVHVRNGKVTMHTRNGNWYSDLYGPLLGPPMRKALSKYDIDVILDGEVMAWDNRRKELVPFGHNRTVANFRRAYMRQHGLLEEIDMELHLKRSTDARVMGNADDWMIKQSVINSDDGKDCWLLFCVFDILFVDGKDSRRLLQRDCGFDTVSTGSIIHLTCLQRKQVLHRMLKEQETEIEICKSVVIRPNGECMSGEEYFGDPIMEYGHPATLLDSTRAAIQGEITNAQEIDVERKGGLADVNISLKRAQAIENFYKTVVEYHKKEGIVVKDLAAPYILGEPSRKRKYWHKFKPDYEKGNAVDIDVVILGGYYASGLKHSGKISQFLCGCVDHEVSSSFMTFCNVNGASTRYDRLAQLLEHTGFKQATKDNSMELGKWFSSDDLPEGEDLPQFISNRSYQRGEEDYDGWKFTRNKNYPDLWINPEDSVVLTIEGQELVVTEDYSVGVALRFPKISKIRLDSMDGEKAANEADTDRDLWGTFETTMRQRHGTSAAMDSSAYSQSMALPDHSMLSRRFLTPEEFRGKTRKRKRKAAPSPLSKVPKVSEPETCVLSGISFAVLDGSYSLHPDSLDAQAAKDEGWFKSALQCKKKEHVMEFILKHGGTVKVVPGIGDKFILGGMETDTRVTNHMKAIEKARHQMMTATTKSKKAEELRKIADSEGILKWTFVYSLVYRWISAQKMESDSMATLRSIKDSNLGMLEPRAHHFLARSSVKEEVVGQDIFALDTSSLTRTDFERALEELGSSHQVTLNVPWQNKEFWLDQFGNNAWERETFGQIFWPYKWGNSDGNQVVVYPHIFNDGHSFGSQDVDGIGTQSLSNSDGWHQWENEGILRQPFDQDILSTIALSHGMGAIITRNLNHQVTHVVSNLIDGTDATTSLDDVKDIAQEKFKNAKEGESLIAHLKTTANVERIQIVSPEWIRKRWEIHFDAV